MARIPSKFSIENGPSKFDLMLALFDRIGKRPRSVRLECRQTNVAELGFGYPECSVDLVITSVTAIDGTREHWKIEGKVFEKTAPDGQRVYAGEYRTDCRKGFLEG